MRPDYKPRPVFDDATWHEVAHICYAELSEDGKVKVDNMTEYMLSELKKRHTGHNALGMSKESIHELLCALIGGGRW